MVFASGMKDVQRSGGRKIRLAGGRLEVRIPHGLSVRSDDLSFKIVTLGDSSKQLWKRRNAPPRHLSGIPLSLDYLDRYTSTSDRDIIVDGGRGWFLSVD